MVVTEHGENRFSKRTGLSKKLAHGVAGKALEHGLRHGQTVGSLRRYLDGLYMKRRTANNMRVYHGMVYIFHDEILITVLTLPPGLCRTAKDIERKLKTPSE